MPTQMPIVGDEVLGQPDREDKTRVELHIRGSEAPLYEPEGHEPVDCIDALTGWPGLRLANAHTVLEHLREELRCPSYLSVLDDGAIRLADVFAPSAGALHRLVAEETTVHQGEVTVRIY